MILTGIFVVSIKSFNPLEGFRINGHIYILIFCNCKQYEIRSMPHLNVVFNHISINLHLQGLWFYPWIEIQNSMSSFDQNCSSFCFLYFYCVATCKDLRNSGYKCLQGFFLVSTSNYANAKGQIISKANFEVFIWTKNRTKIFPYFCPRSLKWVKSKKEYKLLY